LVEATIIDYGVGNLYSVTRAVEHVGGKAVLASSALEIARAKCLILPGVGAFGVGMAGLQERGLVDPIMKYAASGRPLLGICLGMQMLFEVRYEFGRCQGLGQIPGEVRRIELAPRPAGAKIPHVGWSALLPFRGAVWHGTVLHRISPGECAYFVHSYMACPSRDTDHLAHIRYGGADVVAVVRSANIIGCQFHPEKSGRTGLRIIENFLSMGNAG